MTVPWAVTSDKVDAAVKKILEVCVPRKIILFGSYVSGTMNVNSDLDVLIVVGDEISDTRRESVRIRGFLKGISMPMDILVVRETQFKELAKTPGLVYREALEYGEIIYESTRP